MKWTVMRVAKISEKMTQQKWLAVIAGSKLVLQDVPGLAEAALGARPHDTGKCDRI